MNKNIYQISVAALTGVILSACADTSGTGLSGLTQTSATSTNRIYTANLSAVNRSATQSRAQAGTATVAIRGNQVEVVASGTGLDPAQQITGSLYRGGSCPAAISDANVDGVIDINESGLATGQALVGFGNNVSSLAQSNSGGGFAADQNGFFTFRGTGTYSTLAADVAGRLGLLSGAGSSGTTGDASAPASTDPLALESTIVVISGVSNTAQLPATALGAGGFTARQSLPILCGPLVLVSPTASASASPGASPAASPAADNTAGM